MQICYPRRKYETKTIVFWFNNSFWFVFALYFHLGLQICMIAKSKILHNTILNCWTLQIVVKPFKSLKLLKVSVKRIKLLSIAS